MQKKINLLRCSVQTLAVDLIGNPRLCFRKIFRVLAVSGDMAFFGAKDKSNPYHHAHKRDLRDWMCEGIDELKICIIEWEQETGIQTKTNFNGKVLPDKL